MTIFEALDHPWLNVSTILYLLQRVQLLVQTNYKIYRPVLKFLILHDWSEIFVLLMYTDILYALVSLAKSFTCIHNIITMIIFPLKITSCILTVSIYFINKILVTLCISCSTLNLQKGEKTKLFDLQCCK